MSENTDLAGSDDIISLNYESQDTYNEHSYRTKQSANRIEKIMPNQAKENQKPIEQFNDEETDPMQADTQNYSLSTGNNEVAIEQVPITIDTQDSLPSTNPFVIRPPVVQSTLTDESSISVEKEILPVQSPIHEERNSLTESTSKLKVDSNPAAVDGSTTANNLRLYISPSTSLLETTSTDDAQPNPDNTSMTEADGKKLETEFNDKPKEEPMDTSDAQASLGSDGIIESHPTSALHIESNIAIEKSPTIFSPVQSKISISPRSKALYALSQPTTNKFEAILAKLTPSPKRQLTPAMEKDTDSTITIQEEEELFIKESISKTVRRYAVKIDHNGRTLSRELLLERIVEENITTRVEPWPPSENTVRRSTVKFTRPAGTVRKKPTKSTSPKRKTKSLKPTATVVSPKTSKTAQSDNDEVSKANRNEESSDDDDDDNKDDDDVPTDNVSGDEFIPTPPSSAQPSLTKGARIFAKWTDGYFYPGLIGNVNGEKYMIDFDDGAKRAVKSHEIISQSYLPAKQNVTAQTQDGHSGRAVIKRLIQKKKSGKLGYVVQKGGKEKWYPLRFISLTTEQAEHLPTGDKKPTEESSSVVQGKRKRTSNVSQSPNKKSKSSIVVSPNKSQRSTYTPTRQTKLFNTMYFLLTGFNDSMDTRHEIQASIEKHGGKVMEKMPNASRRNHVYLVSDIARKTAKFVDAKKLNIPCVNYKWINDSIQKSEVQDWEDYQLIFPEKESKVTQNTIDGDDED